MYADKPHDDEIVLAHVAYVHKETAAEWETGGKKRNPRWSDAS